MTIWKFPIKTTDVQKVKMPQGAQILCVQVQHDTPCLWALVHGPNSRAKERLIRIFGTGHEVEFPGGLVYIGTYQMQGGALVFHVFEDQA